jgi:hypothetical protein
VALTRKEADKLYNFYIWGISRIKVYRDVYRESFDTDDVDLSEDYLLDRIDKHASIQDVNFKVIHGYSQYNGED